MKQDKRKKAFIGSIIGMAGQIIGSAIAANKERKAMEEQQQMQNKLDAINQAAALSAAYNNQEYADDFKKKVTMKAGGKYKKVNNADRITREKQFKCGGRKKADFGADVLSSLGGGAGIMGDVIGGVANAAGSIASAAMKPKQRIIQKSAGFDFENTDNKEQKDYQLDANGNPIQQEVNNTMTTNAVIQPKNVFATDRPATARMGTKKYKKRC